SDQFAFCVALFEGVYGYKPFLGDDWPTLRDALLAGRIARDTARRRVPRWLRRIIVRGLARDPDERWPTMRALLDALDRGSPFTSRRLALAGGTLVALGVLAMFGARHH